MLNFYLFSSLCVALSWQKDKKWLIQKGAEEKIIFTLNFVKYTPYQKNVSKVAALNEIYISSPVTILVQ
jgi:hypothetical protein